MLLTVPCSLIQFSIDLMRLVLWKGCLLPHSIHTPVLNLAGYLAGYFPTSLASSYSPMTKFLLKGRK